MSEYEELQARIAKAKARPSNEYDEDINNMSPRQLKDAVQEYRDSFIQLKAFKLYVHKRLDKTGVPHAIEGHHLASGCRIGGRLNWLVSKAFPKEKEAYQELTEKPINYVPGFIVFTIIFFTLATYLAWLNIRLHDTEQQLRSRHTPGDIKWNDYYETVD